jgi:hypothetical protein
LRYIACTTVLLLQNLCLWGETYNANLGSQIDTFLLGKASPIAGNGNTFFNSGVTYNVDPRLIVAISGQESSFGTNWAACKPPPQGFNAWSWFYNGNCPNSPFSSFADGIQRVTSGIRRLYLNQGRTTIAAIRQIYCASGCGNWTGGVSGFYLALGGENVTGADGSTTDLTFSSTLIDFEQFTGSSSFFTGAQSPLTVGIATISGGQTLSAATYLPADASTVYGTASFCAGCAPVITIAFAHKVSNVSFFLFNGEPFTVTYTVEDDQGDSQTVSLQANFNSGFGTISLPGTNITNVTITSESGGSWDFLIDNIRFADLQSSS